MGWFGIGIGNLALALALALGENWRLETWDWSSMLLETRYMGTYLSGLFQH